MAGTTTPKLVEEITHVRTGPWAVNYHSPVFVAGSLNAELKAAPTRPHSAIYVTHVTMGVVASSVDGWIDDCNLKLTDGVGSHVFGPVQFCDSGTTVFSKDFTKPLKITDNKALDLTGVCREGYESACFVFVEGYTGDNPIS